MMKYPLLRLKKLGFHKSEPEENWDQFDSAHTNGLNQAAKDVEDMKSCYDGLLSAAAAAANSAYEFSESLQDIGNSLLEKSVFLDDVETGEALSLLERVQLELQKLFDGYRSQIISTVTNPSESFLTELHKVEEMKLQCEEKRDLFEHIVGQLREKGKSRRGKLETSTSEQLKAVREEYDEVARLFIFRVQSLKKGQCRSLLTLAAHHHAAQLNFFRKGLHSLEAVDTHIRNVTERQNISYELSASNYAEEGADGRQNSEASGDGELRHDYSLNNEAETEACRVRKAEAPMSVMKSQGDPMLSQLHRAGSHSAPLYPEKFDPTERLKEMQPFVQKLNKHVLPTPGDAKGSLTTCSTSQSSNLFAGGNSKTKRHSSPLDIDKHKKITDKPLSSRIFSESHMLAEESSNKKHILPLPPSVEGAGGSQIDSQSGYDGYKVQRQAFSGPLVSKPLASRPLVVISGPNSSTDAYGSVSRASGPLVHQSVSVSHTAPLSSPPKVSELHELPRPPESVSSRPLRSVGAQRHSAPLVSRDREASPTNRNTVASSNEGSPLPLPQLTVSRSFSIPSSSPRSAIFNSDKLFQGSQVVTEAVSSSTSLAPLSPSNLNSLIPGQIRVYHSAVLKLL